MEGHDYDNRAAVDDWERYFESWRRRSKEVLARSGAELDVQYGSHPRECFDWFPASSPRQTLIIIHGGYWQWGNKAEFTFLALPWLKRDVAVAVLGYPLAPEVAVPAIVDSVRRGVARVAEKTAGELAIMGWSAGAQLAAEAGASAQKLVCLSGIYDLLPLLATPLNDALRMDAQVAAQCSPAAHPPRVSALVGVGGAERLALRQQSMNYFNELRGNAVPAVLHEWPELNHYSVLDACASEESAVFEDIQSFVTG